MRHFFYILFFLSAAFNCFSENVFRKNFELAFNKEFFGSQMSVIADFSVDQDTICVQDSIHFTDNSLGLPTSWSWSASPSAGVAFSNPSAQNPAAGFSTAGNYTVTLVTTDGGSSDTDTMVVTILPLPTVTASGPFSVCSGNSVSLLAGGANSYFWNSGQFLNDSLISNPVCTPTTSINYTVTGTTSFGCKNTAQVSVILKNSASAIGTAGTIPFGVPANVSFTSTSTAKDSVVWNFGDGTATDTASNLSHTFTSAGTYTVMLVAYTSNGCNDTAIFIVTLQNKSSLTMPNFFTPNFDDVNDVFRPVSTGIKDFYCAIYDRWGLLMFEWDRYNGWWDGHTTSGMECSPGVYYYVVKASGVDGTEFSQRGYVHLFR